MVACVMFGRNKLFLSVGLVVLLDVCVVLGQSNGDFWWLNKKLVNSAKTAREAKPPSARVINVDVDDIKPVTEILDDIPPPVTFRNFISTTLRPQTTTTLVPRTKAKSRTFYFPDEITTVAPKSVQRGVKFQDSNVLESTERTRRPQASFVNRGRAVNRTTTLNPRRRINRVRFQGRSNEESNKPETESKNDQTASASENSFGMYKDLSRYLTFS